MGGIGSGRRPDFVKRLAEQKTPVGKIGGGEIFIPNYSGVRTEFTKAGAQIIFTQSDPKSISFFEEDFSTITLGTGLGDIFYNPTFRVISKPFNEPLPNSVNNPISPGLGLLSFGTPTLGISYNYLPFFCASGTFSEPEDVDQQSVLSSIPTLIYRNEKYRPVAEIQVIGSAVPTDTSMPSQMQFRITKVNQTENTTTMILDGNGLIISDTLTVSKEAKVNNFLEVISGANSSKIFHSNSNTYIETSNSSTHDAVISNSEGTGGLTTLAILSTGNSDSVTNSESLSFGHSSLLGAFMTSTATGTGKVRGLSLGHAGNGNMLFLSGANVTIDTNVNLVCGGDVIVQGDVSGANLYARKAYTGDIEVSGGGVLKVSGGVIVDFI